MDRKLHIRIRRWAWVAPSAATLAVLAACGGGSDDNNLAGGIAAIPVAIVSQPADQSVLTASRASFTVAASGTVAQIQWQVSTDGGATWTNVAGATSTTLTLTSVTTAQNGHIYRAQVSGANGSSATSAPVTLSVAATATAPVISVDVAPVNAVEGGSASFSVTATGASLSYQWQMSTDGNVWTDVASATGATLIITNLPASADGRSYRVKVTNSAGTTTSQAALLSVQAASPMPAVVSQPAAASVVAPATATFSVTATGNPAPTLQWQRSVDSGATFTDVVGATGTSYTTAGTSTSENGALYRVVVTNSAGSTVSDTARLGVSASAIAPAITTQPAAASASAGGQASFSIAVTGAPAPTVQWQRSSDGSTWTSISGATGTVFTTGTLLIADSGTRIRALVTNSVGSVASNAVVLTVNAAASKLGGRAWATGQALESGDGDVAGYSADIDDVGRVTVLFRKTDGSRNVLYATSGTPSAAGTAPLFSTPVALDATAPNNGNDFAVSVAPGGNAVAAWNSSARCNSSSYSTNTTATCNFQYVAQFSVTTGQWSAPVLVGSSSKTDIGVKLTDSGHVLIDRQEWERNGTNSFTNYPGVTWRAAGGSFQQQLLKGLGDNTVSLSEAGQLLVAGAFAQNATTDIVVYRGNVGAGLGTQELLEQRGAAASFIGSWSNAVGQTVVMWDQNNGTNTVRMASALDAANGSFSAPTDLGYTRETNDRSMPFHARVMDNGDFVLYRNGYVIRRTAGNWGALTNFVGWGYWNQFFSAVALNSDASALVFKGSSVVTDGSWASYDGPSQALVQAFVPSTVTTGSGYVLGVKTKMGGSVLLAKNGVGFYLGIYKYDVLPTAARPSGDSRTVDSLWGFYFK